MLPKRIAITGRKRHGKDTAAQVLISNFGFKRIAFADPIKNMIRAYLRTRGCTDEYIDQCLDGDLKEVEIPELGGRSPRFAMQQLGNEWGREIISPTLWIDAWKDTVQKTDLVVTPDLRYPNEEAAARAMGFFIIKVYRPGLDDGKDLNPSEAMIDKIAHDYLICNDFPSADDFQAHVFHVLNHHLLLPEPVS